MSVLAIITSGCSTRRAVNRHLEAVAKDWCRTIRASQIIPVYPLTEDIQPGDVFLVHTPIQYEQKNYDKDGYLPLDYHLVRLPPPDYVPFYGSDRYAINPSVHPPAHWQFPPAAKPGTTNWAAAPRAAFPTYSFSVSRSAGLNVGIPVSGVPLGLNLLGSSSATGTVTISDTYTYGVDIKAMSSAVLSWASRPEVRAFLSAFPPKDTGDRDPNAKAILEHSYLRVVTRVYLASRVTVSLYTGRAGGGTFSAGERRPVEKLNIAQDSNAAANIEALNRLLLGEPAATPSGRPQSNDDQAPGTESASSPNSPLERAPTDVSAGRNPQKPPGGTVQVAMASSRSVSLVETFARPLVVGYLGFDISIEKDGKPGQIMSTLSRLEGWSSLPTTPIPIGKDCFIDAFGQWLYHEDGTVQQERQRLLQSWLDENGLSEVDLSDFIFGEKYRTQRAAAAGALQVECSPSNGD